jgi:hypothetical protein
MTSARMILIAGAHLCVVATALAQGATAIQGDGTVVEVRESVLAGLDERTWPGWPGLWMGSTLPQAQDGGSAMTLQDGQVLVGGFEPNGQELWWRSPKIGAVRVDLERVARIGPLAADATRPVARDEVHFVNGDRAEGFIQSIDATHGVRLAPITPEGTPSTEVVDHDLERVVALWLASRPEPAKGWRFWLRDGSVIDADHWTREGEQIILEGCHLAGAPPRLPLDWGQVIAVRSAPTAVLALASQPWKSADVMDTPRLSPARGRLGSGSHALDLSSIDLHGPGIFEATLPQGEWILDASLGVPPGLAGRVSCMVVILDGDREIVRHPITESSTITPLHTTIRSGRLVVRIEASQRGAFGAALRMIRPLLVPITAAAAGPSPSRSSETVRPAGQ